MSRYVSKNTAPKLVQQAPRQMGAQGTGRWPEADTLVANTTPRLLRLRVVHDIGVVDRRLPLRDLARLALSLRLHVLRLRNTRQHMSTTVRFPRSRLAAARAVS